MRVSATGGGLGGIGITILFAGWARVSDSAALDLGLIVIGVAMILLATRLPQVGLSRAIRAVNSLVGRVRTDQDAVAAVRLLRNVAFAISTLPTRETGEFSFAQLVPFLGNVLGGSRAVGLYRRHHRAATIHAVKVALRAGVVDNGTLALAEAAQTDADLLELRAELLRMVDELRHGAEARRASAQLSAAGQMRR